VLQFGLRSVFAGTNHRLAAVALPIATAATATAPASTPPFAMLAFTECAAFLTGLRLTKTVFLR
jgi:hypothetical protein